MSIDAEGKITWTPPDWVKNDPQEVKVKVSDESEGIDTITFMLDVKAINDAPELDLSNCNKVLSVKVGTTFTCDADARDPDIKPSDIDTDQNLTFSLENNIYNMAIDEDTGEISWTPNDNDFTEPQIITVLVKVKDAASTFDKRNLNINVHTIKRVDSSSYYEFSLGYEDFVKYQLSSNNIVKHGKLYLRKGEGYKELDSSMEIKQGEKIYFKLDIDTLKQNKGILTDETFFTLIAFDSDGIKSQTQIINYIDINHVNEVPSITLKTNKTGTIGLQSPDKLTPIHYKINEKFTIKDDQAERTYILQSKPTCGTLYVGQEIAKGNEYNHGQWSKLAVTLDDDT